MLLSIIIPAYNASGTIDASLQSIESQTIAPSEALRQILADAGVSPDSDFEIIVVDDGSTDDTAAVVRRHISAHPQIRLIQKANGGVSSARNAGMAEAQGEYLHF
ncbi:MAG: glycosyltransferase family 2 protein, partial [Muribaculaceae bacterium]